MKKLRFGVIGTSNWADSMYLTSLHSHPQVELAALCGRSPARAAELAAKYHIPQVYTDYQAMYKQAGLEAVVIGSPDDLHHPMALAAFAAGLHVLCDKPLALSEQQAAEMLAAAEHSGRQHGVLFTYRWLPAFRYAHDLVQQGLVGRCYQAEFRFLLGYARRPDYHWRLDPQRANGALGDLGVHLIDMGRWLVGEIDGVQALAGAFAPHPGPDGAPMQAANDSCNLLVQFENGAHGNLHASLVTHLAERKMQLQVKLYGEGGSLELDVHYGGPHNGARLLAARAGEAAFQQLEPPPAYWGPVNPSDPYGVFTQQSAGCRAFVDAILNDQPFEPNFYDGYKAQQVIEAALGA